MNRGDMNTKTFKRGEIYYADLSPVKGSEQGGNRPVLIIQNDLGNHFSPTVIVAAITGQIQKAKLPTHVEISAKQYGLEKNSVILFEQLRTIDKTRLGDKVSCLDDIAMKKANFAINISLGLVEMPIPTKRKNNTNNRRMVAAV